LVKPQILIPINMIGGALGTAVCCLLGAKGDIPPVGGIYGFVSVTNGWAYLAGIAVGAIFIAVASSLLVDFNDNETSGGDEVSLDEIEVSFDM
jgi:PTS system fructose-specific IIC component